MAASLQVAPLSLKAVVASYILSLAVFIPISGWMADRFGTRRVFFTAVARLHDGIAAVRTVARTRRCWWRRGCCRARARR